MRKVQLRNNSIELFEEYFIFLNCMHSGLKSKCLSIAIEMLDSLHILFFLKKDNTR